MEHYSASILHFLQIKLRLKVTLVAVDFIKTQKRAKDRRNVDECLLYFLSLHVYRYKEVVDVPKPLRDN